MMTIRTCPFERCKLAKNYVNLQFDFIGTFFERIFLEFDTIDQKQPLKFGNGMFMEVKNINYVRIRRSCETNPWSERRISGTVHVTRVRRIHSSKWFQKNVLRLLRQVKH